MFSLSDYLCTQLNEAFDPNTLPGVDQNIINTAIAQGLKDVKYLKNGKLKIKYDTKASSVISQLAFEELLKLGDTWDFSGKFEFAGTSLHGLHLISKKGYNGSWNSTDHLTIQDCTIDSWFQLLCPNCLCIDSTFNEPLRVAGDNLPRFEGCTIKTLNVEKEVCSESDFNKSFDVEQAFNLKKCKIENVIFQSLGNYTFYQTKAQMNKDRARMARPDNTQIELKNGWWVTY